MSAFKRRKNRNQGEFIPKNSVKYKGRYPIIVRSTWERMFSQWLDMNPSVIEWSSESHVVNYYDPVQMKRRRYYPDYYMKVTTRDGGFRKYLVEIKPYRETLPPKKTKGQSKKTKLYQESTYLTNQAKWEAAKRYCQKMGLEWKIITEKEMFNK